MESLKQLVRDVPNFPKQGIMFKDISPLLGNPDAFRTVIHSFAKYWQGKIDAIAALDARGFIFGGALAVEMSVPLALVRKKGKLPSKSVSISYSLEYGENVLELHEDAFSPGMRVLIVDDLLATGGTAAAAQALVQQTGASVVGYAFVIELMFLDGRSRLGDIEVNSLIMY